jgi:hypothetical protein
MRQKSQITSSLTQLYESERMIGTNTTIKLIISFAKKTDHNNRFDKNI